MIQRVPWGDFPDVQIHTTVSKLVNCPEYQAAKSGNYKAAYEVVKSCIKEDKLNSLPKTDFVVPVIQMDGERQNALPLAFAKFVSKFTGAELKLDIIQTNQVSHTKSTGIERLQNQPEFEGLGNFKQGSYLVLDDVVTYGSTLANLRGYIENEGGKVELSSTLAAGYGSTKIVPPAKIMREVKNDENYNKFTDKIGFSAECLTNREARHLLRSKEIIAARTNRTQGLG